MNMPSIINVREVGLNAMMLLSDGKVLRNWAWKLSRSSVKTGGAAAGFERERHIRLNYLGTFFVDVAPDYVALIGSTYILFVNAPSLGLFKQKVYKVTKEQLHT